MSIPQVPAPLASALADGLAPQPPFAWSRAAWAHALSGVEHVPSHLASLPDGLDRQTVATVVEERLRAGRTVEAFVTAMIWGYGTTGYGPWRTARVLTGALYPQGRPGDPGVVDNLSESATIAASAGAIEAYRFLNNGGHIKHLGPAFFTKWIYFVTAAGDAHGATGAPILDKVVLEWLNTQTDLSLRPYSTDDYTTYLATLDAWAGAHGATPVKVEETIFLVARGTP